MLTREEDVDAHALRRQGWTISAIARHLGRDRKTIRAYLNGERTAGQRRQAPDAFVPFLPYCRQRLADDPHLWASTLFDEVVGLGYEGAYSTFTRALRRYRVRPHCEPCHASTGRDVAVIAHPPGEEIQFDWLELPDPPEGWGVGAHAHLLVGALAHSGRWRAVLAESEDFPHLVQALDDVVRKLGGTARRWRFDRMATVCYPSSGQVTAAFAAVAKYYGVGVDICPPRRGNRKGVVEKANHSAAQGWWRTVPDGLTVVQAQSGVDKLSLRMDGRRRRIDGAVTTVGELAAAEPLLDIPVRPFPAELEIERTVSPQSWSPSTATPTPSLPACPASRSRSCTGSARTTCGSSPPAGPSSPATAGPREVPGRPSGTTDTSSRWRGRCCRRSPTGLPARPRSANRRQPQPWPKPSVCAKGRPPAVQPSGS